MHKYIVIISVEGVQSYTEVNFFEGIKNHKQDLELKVFALAKSAKNKTKLANKIKTINELESTFWTIW